MITINAYKKVKGAEDTLSVNIDHIIALQRQNSVEENDFTMVIIFGAPPFKAKETEKELLILIADARRKRNGGPTFSFPPITGDRSK